MDKYISVTKFKESLAELTVEGGTEATRAAIMRTLSEVVPKLLDDEPAADVQPIRHGHWYDNTYRYVGELDAYFIQACCSCCNRYSDKLDQYTKIMSNETCSHCGTRMDGDME